MLIMIAIIMIIMFGTTTYAVPVPLVSVPLVSVPHTVHNVTTNNRADCQFAHVYEENFYFVNMNTNLPIIRFKLESNETLTYGFVLTAKTTFNLLYTLTCIEDNGTDQQTPKASFVVGADGEAQPNINVLNYYGAVGMYKIIQGVGENYQFQFPL
jgi:hypothetical protein